MAMTERPREPEEFNPYAPPLAADPGRGAASRPDGMAPVTSVSYRLTPEDVRDAQQGLGAVKPRPWLIFVPAIVAFVVVFYFSDQPSRPRPAPDVDPGSSQWTALLAMAVPTVGLLVLLVVVIVGWFKRRKGMESPHEITTTIDPEGLRMLEADFYNAKTSWPRFSEIRETPTMILFLNNAFDPTRGKDVMLSVVPIPKRAFTTPEAAASFLEAARRWHAAAIAAKPSEAGHAAPNAQPVD
jgi:hypothetical protein